MKPVAALLLVVQILGLTTCGWVGGNVGTPGYSVVLTNAGQETVTVFAAGVGDDKNAATTVGVRLAPGTHFVDHWLTPNSGSGDKPATVRAISEAGRLIYCRQLSWGELKAMSFEVTIREGDSAGCGP
jgi:hypothetical protein